VAVDVFDIAYRFEGEGHPKGPSEPQHIGVHDQEFSLKVADINWPK